MLGWLTRKWKVRRYKGFLVQPVSLRRRDGQGFSNNELGDYGERLAEWYLTVNGRSILYRKFVGPNRGEVDLVMRDGDVLTFVEVKTRREGGLGRPLDAVNQKKRQLMRRGGKAWLKLLGDPEIPWRFDVAEILVTEGEVPKIQIVQDVETQI